MCIWEGKIIWRQQQRINKDLFFIASSFALVLFIILTTPHAFSHVHARNMALSYSLGCKENVYLCIETGLKQLD